MIIIDDSFTESKAYSKEQFDRLKLWEEELFMEVYSSDKKLGDLLSILKGGDENG